MSKPLTSMMDNVLAWRMGEAAREAMKRPAGDPIDTGLILLRLLNEAGLDVVLKPGVTGPIFARPTPSEPPQSPA